MFKLNEIFSNHHIFENGEHVGWIDVHGLMLTLRSLKKIDYQEKYCIKNTILKDYELKEDVLAYYKKYGVYDKPIVVTTENFCLDGRHRVHYNLSCGNNFCKAYIVPHNMIKSFIKKTTQ